MKEDLRIYPHYAKVDKGNAVAFHCKSLKETVWFFNSMQSNSLYSDDPLILNSVTENNQGVYYCYGTDENSKHFVAKSVLLVYGE